MANPQIVEKARIQQLIDLLEGEGINATAAIYQELSNLGYGYAGWAYGVATGESITGQGALLFMQSRGEKNGITIQFDKVDNIRVGMLEKYLYKLLEKSQLTGFVNEDVSFQETLDFHIEVFEKNNLDINYWTLQTPMALVYQYLGGVEGQEKVWSEIRDTDGTGLDALFSSLGLVAIVEAISRGVIYLDENNQIVNKHEIDRNPELILSGKLTKIIISQDYIKAANEWSSNVSTFEPLWKYINKDVNAKTIIGDQSEINQDDYILVVNPITDSNIKNIIFGLGGKDLIHGANAKDLIYGGSENDELYGGDGEDELYGGLGNDKLYGGEKNDYLNGGLGDDIFDGGSDDDIFVDESGSDTYIFNGIFGHDTIYDSDGNGLIKIDDEVLKVGDKVNERLWKSENGLYSIALLDDFDGVATTQKLIIRNNDKNNSITIKYFKNGYLGLILSDLDSVPNMPDNSLYSFGNDGNNIIYSQKYVASFGGNDYIQTTEDNDIVISGKGNDLISTGDGDDLIYAGEDNDIIISGEGSDTIYGEEGDDLILTSATLEISKTKLINDVGQISDGNDELIRDYSGLNFYYLQDFDENGRTDSYFIHNSTGVLTHQILPIINIHYTGGGKDYSISNYLVALNYGEGRPGSDIAYGGAGNDIIIGSSDTDFIYGGDDHDNLYGMNGNDFLYGGTGDDIVYGGDGLDYVEGGSGKDLIVGGLDRDIIYGGDGDDSIQGDLSDLAGTNSPPSYVPYNRFGNDLIYGGAGNDHIWGNLGNDEIYGDEGNDHIYGDHHAIAGNHHGNDRIYGGSGNDFIWGDGGEDEIYGGDGDDQIQGDNGSLDGQFHKDDIIDGGAGDDKIWGNGGSDRIYGGDGNDELQGDSSQLEGQHHGDDQIFGGKGDDKIWGHGGSDNLYGGEGNDYLDGDSANTDGQYHGKDKISGDEGDDTIFGRGNDDEIYGGAGNDYIEGDSTELDGQYHGNDKIYGDAGDDTIYGNGGDDELYGGTGNDYLAGDQKDNREIHGNDKIYGGQGDDTLLGFDGDDILDGGEGDDIIFGGNGNDTIYSYDGNDQLAGGDGDDTYHIRIRDAEVKILDNSTSNHVYLEGDFDFSKVKLYWYTNAVSLITPTVSNDSNAVFPQFKLTFFDDSTTQPVADENGVIIEGETLKDEYENPITGGYDHYLHFNTRSNRISAFSSKESSSNEYVIHLDTYLKERAGISYHLWTGSWYGIQAPYLIFTNGYIIQNKLIYDGSEIGDSLDIEQIRNNVNQYGQYQADEYHLLGGDDSVQGSSSADVIFGGAGDDSISGQGGDDQLHGDEGHDVLFGGYGDDTLTGGDGNDQLSGDNGNDTLDGGDGNDQLYGGEGDDILYGGDGDDQILGDSGNDQLYGGVGNDQLYGGHGSDILDGGAGENILQGGEGIDEYIFDGLQQAINEIQDTDDNILRFINLNSEQTRLEVINNDLYIYYGADSYVKLSNYIEKPYISTIQFDDVAWDRNELNSKIILTQYGDEYSNNLIGKKYFTNILYAEDGHDVLSGGDVKNYLYGGAGEDIFYTGGQNSINYMYGGVGNDTYNVQFNNTSLINDEDYTGTIKIRSDVYFTLEGNVFTQSPYASQAELISTSGNHSTYRYTLNNKPLLNIQYDSEEKTFAFYKNEKLVFAITDIENIQNISDYSNFQIRIEGEEVYHTIGKYSHYVTTTFNFIDFVNSISNITSYYGNEDDEIIGYGDSNNIIYAGDGHNIITTGSGNDTIYGGQNNDEIYAGDGNNIIVSGDGGDIIVVGNGRNTITSGSGDDQIRLGHGYNEVSTGAGNDYIYGGYGHIDAGSGDDVILGVSGSIYGGQGNDTIIASDAGAYMDGGEGADHLVGGLGDDIYIVDEFDTFEENDVDGGYDTIHIARDFDLALNNFEAVTLLGDQNLNAYGDEFDNILIGNIGNNYLDGRTGSDYMMGGAGDDYYIIDTADKIEIDEYGNSYLVEGDRVVEYDSEGIDTVERWIDDLYIKEDQSGNLIQTNLYKTLQDNIENLVLKGQAKVAFGNDLDNIITLNENDNYVDGGVGNDTYIYSFGGGKDTLVFKDSIEAFNTLVINGFNESQIYARQFGNHLTINFKDRSNDQIIINNYFIDDDLENDISYKPKEIKLSNGFVLDAAWIDHSLHNLEGTNGDDVISGLSRSENIYGGLGNDLLYGGAGNDSLYGGADNDILIGGAGADTLNGGAGDDKYYYYLTDGADVIDQTGGGNDVLWLMDYGITPNRIGFSRETNDLIVMIDQNANQSIRVVDHFLGGEKAISAVQPNGGYSISAKDIDGIIKAQEYGGLYDTVLEGTNNTETIYGTSGNDLIQGLDGNDTIWAQDGNDRLEGGSGNDYLDAGAGNDFLYGGIGNDTLIGGAGNDVLDGGAGDDKYYYYLADGADVIDQTGGGTDVIWLMDQGITEDRVKFTKENNDLLITIDNNSNQSIRVKDHFLGGEKAISSVQPNGGYTITAAQIATKVNNNGGAETPNVAGDTTYNYSTGALTITEQSGTDKIVFASGITLSQISSNLTKSGNDLIIKVNGSTTNIVTVKSFFLAGDYLVESFQTAAGEQITASQIFTAYGLTIPGTGSETPNPVGDTTYNYTSGALTITEHSGTDKVVFASGITFSHISSNLTMSGNDLIIKVNGSTANILTVKNFFLAGNYLVETFQTAAGEQITANQIFTAFGLTMPGTGSGAANAEGDTTYNYTSGDLTITEASGNDKVVFASGITFSQIGNYLTMSGNDLILKVNGSTTNKITVKNFFLAGNNLVETFKFSTGEEITAADIFGAFGLTLPSTGGGTGAGSSEVEGDTTYEYITGALMINEVSGNDKVVFKNGITFSQIGNYLNMSGNDLILKLDGSNTNKVTVKDFFLGGNNVVETFAFETGGQITASQIFGAFGLAMPAATSSTSVESFSFDNESSMYSDEGYQNSGENSPLNAEDYVQSIITGDAGDNLFISDAAVSELFILNGGQDVIKLLQDTSGTTAVDYVSDFKLSDDQIDISEFLDNTIVNSSNLDKFLNISYDETLKTNTISVNEGMNGNSKELLILTNQTEYLSVQDLLLNQSIIY